MKYGTDKCRDTKIMGVDGDAKPQIPKATWSLEFEVRFGSSDSLRNMGFVDSLRGLGTTGTSDSLREVGTSDSLRGLGTMGTSNSLRVPDS